jgi:hypothetical protein
MTALTQPAADRDPSEFPDPEHRPLAVGDILHFYAAVAVNDNPRMGAPGRMMAYGSEYTVTAEFLQANPPGQRGSLWELLDDEPGQLARYGQIVVARGPWPAGTLRTQPGTPEHDAARSRLESAAWATHGVEGPEAYEQIALVRAVYGQPGASNRSQAVR